MKYRLNVVDGVVFPYPATMEEFAFIAYVGAKALSRVVAALTQCGTNGKCEKDRMVKRPLERILVFVGGVICYRAFTVHRQLRQNGILNFQIIWRRKFD